MREVEDIHLIEKSGFHYEKGDLIAGCVIVVDSNLKAKSWLIVNSFFISFMKTVFQSVKNEKKYFFINVKYLGRISFEVFFFLL